MFFFQGHVRCSSSLFGDAITLYRDVVSLLRLLKMWRCEKGHLCEFVCFFLFVRRVNPWLKPLAYTSLGVFLLGFLLWNIDNIFCETLRSDLVVEKCAATDYQLVLNGFIMLCFFVDYY